jgi:hypothetical protein
MMKKVMRMMTIKTNNQPKKINFFVCYSKYSKYLIGQTKVYFYIIVIKMTLFHIKNHSNFIPKEIVTKELYENCLSEKQQLLIVKYLFDSEQFLEYFGMYKNKSAYKKALRIMVQIGTVDSFLRGKYFLTNGKFVNIDLKKMKKNIKETKMYKSDHIYKESKKKYNSTDILIYEEDCLKTGLYLKNSKNLNPVVCI